ncbi:MAG TPA: GNAT family protein [Ignavibacteria bacterium]|nr:GNAT family protein [Ignavibacteria bacterium]
MNFIETDRLILKTIGESEISLLADYYLKNLSFLKKSIPVSDASFYTIDNLRNRILNEKDLFEKRFQISLYVFIKKNMNSLIGNVSVLNITGDKEKTGFLGYQIDERSNGKGFASEAAAAIIDHVFSNLNFFKLEANVMTSNHSSVKVLGKLGFEKTEYLKYFMNVNGRAEDHFRYTLINNKQSQSITNIL